MNLLAPLALAGLLAPARADTLTVGPDPGHDFAAIQPAIDAPAPGIDGQLFLDERSVVSLGSIELDAARTGLLAVPVGPGPLFSGGVAVVQWIAEGAGAPALSNPALAYRISE